MAKPKAQTLQQRFGFLDDDLKTPKHDEIMLWLDENCISIVEELFWCSEWNEQSIKDWINRTSTAITYAKETANKALEQSRKELKKYENEDNYSSNAWAQRAAKSIESNEKWLTQLNEWTELAHPPEMPCLEEVTYDTVWEEPVTSKNYKSTYTRGFIDFVYYFHTCTLHVKGVEGTGNRYPRYTPQGDKIPDWTLETSVIPEWEIQESRHKKVFFEVKSTIPSLGELIRQIQMYRQHVNGQFVIVSPDDRLAPALKKQNIYFYKYPF